MVLCPNYLSIATAGVIPRLGATPQSFIELTSPEQLPYGIEKWAISFEGTIGARSFLRKNEIAVKEEKGQSTG